MIGGLLLLFAREGEGKDSGVRAFALAVSLVTFVLSAVMYLGFRPDFAGMQFVEEAPGYRGSGFPTRWAWTESACCS